MYNHIRNNNNCRNYWILEKMCANPANDRRRIMIFYQKLAIYLKNEITTVQDNFISQAPVGKH